MAEPTESRWLMAFKDGGRRASLLVAILAALTFLRPLGFGLVWDDPALVKLARAEFRDGGAAGLLAAEFRLDRDASLGFFRPVVLASLLVDSKLGGGSPFPFHLTNLLLHVACCVLLHRLLLALGSRGAPALVGAAIFAVHPVHVESVAFVSGRTDLFAGAFVLAGFVLWIRDRGLGPWRMGIRPAAGLAAFAAACLSKELAFAAPLVLVLWDFLLPPAEASWRRRGRWLWSLGSLGVVAIVLALRTWVAGIPLSFLAEDAAAGEPLASRLALAPSVLMTALRLLVAPWPLRAYYTADQVAPGIVTIVAVAAVVLAWILLAAPKFARAGLLSAAWTLAFLLPTSGIVAHGSAAVAERFLYVASAGVPLLALAWRALPPLRERAALAAAAAIVVVFFGWSVARSGAWRQQEILAQALIEESPRCVEGYLGLAHIRGEQGRQGEAVELLQRALAVDPESERAYTQLGLAFGRSGRYGESVESFRRALELRPEYPDALANLGYTYLLMRQPGQAVSLLERAVRARPDFASAWSALGTALGASGDPNGAASAFGRTLELEPENTDARFGLVMAHVGAGRPELAWKEQRALAAIDERKGATAAEAIRRAGYASP